MTLLLAIDTATAFGSVALGRPGEPLTGCFLGGRRHAAAVTAAVDHALRMGDAGHASLSGVVVADGPGSFTGLRVGWATAQGLCRATAGLDVWRAPSLMATAWTASRFHDGPIAAMYDAYRGEVFAAVYRFEGRRVTTVFPPSLCAPDALCRQPGLEPVVAVGDGAVLHAPQVTAWTGRPPITPPAGALQALALIELVAFEGAVSAVPDIAAYAPDYGCPTEAQVRWEQAHGRALPHSPGDAG